MKKQLIGVCLLCFTILSAKAQTTVTIQPDSTGSDFAEVISTSPTINSHFIQLMRASYDSSNNEIIRCYLRFDLSSLPANITIQSADLSLYADNATAHPDNFNINPSPETNQSVLKNVNFDWNENNINWNSKPSSSLTNQITLSATTSNYQHVLNISIIPWVQDWADIPANNFGMVFQLQNETFSNHSRRMIFASPLNNDATLRPKLLITYVSNDAMGFKQPDEYRNVTLLNNPGAEPHLYFNVDSPTRIQITLVNTVGQIIQSTEWISSPGNEKFIFNQKNIAPGLYFANIVSDNKKLNTCVKLIITP